jgi:hypothetical protein
MTAVSTAGTAPASLAPARSPRARACPPAASLRWPGRPSCIRCRA